MYKIVQLQEDDLGGCGGNTPFSIAIEKTFLCDTEDNAVKVAGEIIEQGERFVCWKDGQNITSELESLVWAEIKKRMEDREKVNGEQAMEA
jgi:hypothetical protein